ncbi:hypothetical protein AKJ37_00945 [candidate division MSBL1 archaeon SCGC-AAA259I09]|uniref:AbiEi antitoxin C-terminal domain-containing protein n=2 Tax=candidate division MSBL1 TaxID=215777 RepID=A0A133UTL5_9EURY|nr:hypothetical protein AKJ38_00895 [candidate division MSBL1 archaeon SCGC-AAA259I14]KXA98187.1 hypothetical protein AKJ37_00945 [candidate division MSBL1 archaeon SCGC-AAA259I09]
MSGKRGKIESLSPTEQEVYSKLYSERVIDTEDVKGVLGDPHKSAEYIKRLRNKGYLQKIRKGLYAVVPPNLIGEEFKPDKFLIASKTRDECYISYHSALELHGLSQSIHNTVLVTTKGWTDSFSFQSITYKFVTTKYSFGFEKMAHQGVKVSVSDREKTFLDCTRRIKHAGGLEELMKSLNNLPSLDWDKLGNYLKRFDEKKLYQKTGFILESLDIRGSEETLNKLEEKVGDKTYYLERGRESSFNKKWNLMIPKNLPELMRGA